MKILILGDVHLGAGYNFGKPDQETGINSRLLDYKDTLSKVIDYAIDNKFELFIFLGDIFETRNPTSQQMVIFYSQGIEVWLLSGNHDYIKTRKITSSLDPLKEISLPNVSVFTDIEARTFINSNNEKANFIMMPYRNRQSYDKNTNEEAINELSNELNTVKKQLGTELPILLCGHMMVENTIPSDAGECGLNELVLPFDIFSNIDVVVNGHIHRSSIVKQKPAFIYSGSMECKDFGEKEHQKCFLIYDTDKSGIDTIEFKTIDTRKFIDFELDYSVIFPNDPMTEILNEITSKEINNTIVRMNIKVPENKIIAIDVLAIRKAFHNANVYCIADVSISPVIAKQMRNLKVHGATDDLSAFRHYIGSQFDVADDVLNIGLSIIRSEIED